MRCKAFLTGATCISRRTARNDGLIDAYPLHCVRYTMVEVAWHSCCKRVGSLLVLTWVMHPCHGQALHGNQLGLQARHVRWMYQVRWQVCCQFHGQTVG